jgi:hypothetical protein
VAWTALGFITLVETHWRVLPSDKDGVFCLVSHGDLQQLACEVVLNNSYLRVSRDSMDFFRIETLYKEVVNGLPDGDLSKAEKQHLKKGRSGALAPSVSSATSFSPSNHTKKAGQVTTRNIHALAGSPLAPLGKCIAMQFKEYLNSLDHLVKDSIDLTNCLSRIVVPARSFFGRLTSNSIS